MDASSKRKPPNWRRSKNQAKAHAIDLYYLDESGFAPTLPTTYTWARKGHRPIVPYEAPQGRRVNVIGAYAPFADDGPKLLFESRAKRDGCFDASVYLSFVRTVAGVPAGAKDGYRRSRPCVIVQDNYSVHVCKPVQEEKAALEKAGVTLFQLPAYSPKLNRIELVWRQVKHHDLTTRSHTTDQALKQNVDAALAKRADSLAKSLQTLEQTA